MCYADLSGLCKCALACIRSTALPMQLVKELLAAQELFLFEELFSYKLLILRNLFWSNLTCLQYKLKRFVWEMLALCRHIGVFCRCISRSVSSRTFLQSFSFSALFWDFCNTKLHYLYENQGDFLCLSRCNSCSKNNNFYFCESA